MVVLEPPTKAAFFCSENNLKAINPVVRLCLPRRLQAGRTQPLIDVLKKVDASLVPHGGGNKLGGIKHFHSLAPEAQRAGVAIGSLQGFVNSGHYPQIHEARTQFDNLAAEIIKRAGI